MSDVGETTSTLRWRDGRPHGGRPWASFDVEPSGDVLYAAQVDGEAPPGSYPVATADGTVGVWRHPHDPVLPGLARAASPGALGVLLSTIDPDIDADRVQLVALQPLQRAVLRVGSPERGVYVKVLPPWRTLHVAGQYRRAHSGGLPSPEVLAVESVTGLLVLQELAGRPLAQHLETGLPVPEAAAVWALVEQMGAIVGCHGDLHDRQLLVDADGCLVGVVDLDEAGAGDVVDDLGRLIAHIASRGRTHPAQRARVDSIAAQYTAWFADRLDPHALRRSIARAERRLMRT